MKKLFLSLISASLLISPLFVLAQGTVAPTLDVLDVLDNVTNWLFAILLIIAVIFILIAAYYFVTAAGSPDKVKSARDFILWALIGVLVAFVAKGLVLLVRTIAQG